MNIVKSTGTFGFYTIISRLLGYLRDVLIAIFLGTGFLADVFFVAFRIPNTFRRLFAEGTFNAAFVPSYTSELVKKKSKSNKFANEIFNLLFLGLFFLILVIELFMPLFVSLIAPGFVENQEKIKLATNLTRITFPFLMFVCLSSFFAAILNSHNKFAAASAAPVQRSGGGGQPGAGPGGVPSVLGDVRLREERGGVLAAGQAVQGQAGGAEGAQLPHHAGPPREHASRSA